jgi:hypothetical protein
MYQHDIGGHPVWSSPAATTAAAARTPYTGTLSASASASARAKSLVDSQSL